MDATSFFGLRPTDDERTWILPVERRLCSGLGALWGGVALGAAIEVANKVTGRPLAWATSQFLSFVSPGEDAKVELVAENHGRTVSQFRVMVSAGDREIALIAGAVGQRFVPDDLSWEQRPDVAHWSECVPRPPLPHHRGTISDHIQIRLAKARTMEELPGEIGDGSSSLWVRMDDLDHSSVSLAVLGDYVPFGIGQAMGQFVGGPSLDNTVRIRKVVPTEWVLVDVRIHGVANGFGHGLAHLWAENGTLMATASQTTALRKYDPFSEIEAERLRTSGAYRGPSTKGGKD